MPKRPNFLFIITDQHRADHLGCYGNRIVRTPHIDRLAARGVRGDNCHVAAPLCMPNRSSLMTGRMPSVHGVRHNGIELSHGETTVIEQLRNAGYRTALVGKSHLQNVSDSPPQLPPDPKDRLAREARPRAPGRYHQEQISAWENDPTHELTLPYYGFERVDLTIEHGDDQYGHWRRWIRRQTNEADRLIGPENAEPTPDFELSKCRQAWRTRVPEELYPTSWITERTIARLRDYATGNAPFFIECSFPDPHHPYTPPGKYWSMYAPDDVPLPESFSATHRNIPPHLKWCRDMRDTGKAVKHSPMQFACNEREAREAIALNYGSITMIDDGIGRILAELDRLGLADNTVIVFTADHGDFTGEHQLLLKGPLHYRAVVRVPFIWADPASPRGRTTGALFQSIDIAPTILERAGVAGWYGIQGRSLRRLLAGETAEHNDSLLIEEEGQRRPFGLTERIRARTLVTHTHRVSVYAGAGWGELYDLRNDPLETINLWDDPGAAGVRSEMLERLARRMIDYTEISPYPDNIA